MKSTIFSGQPPDTHQEIPHTTSSKASRTTSRYLVDCFLLELCRDEASRGRGVGRKSMQTEGRHLGLRPGGCAVC